MDHALRMKLQDHGNKQSEDLKIEYLSKYTIREVICTIREVKDSISSAIRDVKRNTLPFDISSHSRCLRELSTIRDLKLFDKSIIRDLKPFDISDWLKAYSISQEGKQHSTSLEGSFEKSFENSEISSN